MKMLCALLLAVGVAFGGEVPRDSDGKPMVLHSRPKCRPMFEVKDVQVAVYKSATSTETTALIAVYFVQRKSAEMNVAVTLVPGLNAHQSPLTAVAEKVGRDKVGRVMFKVKLFNAPHPEGILYPHVTFENAERAPE